MFYLANVSPLVRRTNERIPQAVRQAAWKKRGPNLFSSVCRCPPFLSLSLVLSLLREKKGQVVLLYRYTVLVVGKRTIGFRSNYAFPVSLGPRLQKYIVRPNFFLANENLYLL